MKLNSQPFNVEWWDWKKKLEKEAKKWPESTRVKLFSPWLELWDQNKFIKKIK
jgi:hypothetical protein